ncbi:hypothetical protein KKB40_01050 [Patescibacteria group bacterium]|nr:hypothetical protein [Patescibacteria group bacterium]
MRKRDNLGEDTPAKRKLVKIIKKKDPYISKTELNHVLSGIKRFVMLSQKIINEPQANFAFKTKTKRGKKYKFRYIKTDIVEVGKILRSKKGESHSIQEAFGKIVKTFPEK